MPQLLTDALLILITAVANGIITWWFCRRARTEKQTPPNGKARELGVPAAAKVVSQTPAPEPTACVSAGARDVPRAPPANVLERDAFSRQVHARLAEWKRGGSLFSVMLVEMDHADEATRREGLPAIADFVVGFLRDMDSVGYFRPGCLGVLLPRVDVRNGINVAERLRWQIAHSRFPAAAAELQEAIHIGMVQAEEHDDGASLLQRGEVALDAAIRYGGNATFLHDGKRPIPISSFDDAMGALLLEVEPYQDALWPACCVEPAGVH